MNRILRLWWLVLAWLLAMFGKDFWDFNVMELFASIAIIVGAFWAIRGWLKDRHRKQKLICFPYGEWSAQRKLPQSIFEITAIVDVLVPHYSFAYNGHVYLHGEPLPVKFSKPEQSLSPLRQGRWIMIGTIPLSSIPGKENQVEVFVDINLDGDFKQKSGKNMLSITTVGIEPSTLDKGGSQT